MPASAAYPRLSGSRITDLHLEWMAAWPRPGRWQSGRTCASWTVVALAHADRIVCRGGPSQSNS